MIEQTPKTGEILAYDLLTKTVEFPALASQFLYANTSTMLAADPGTGKSTIVTQISVSLSSGRLLFDKLEVERPLRIYHLSFEMVYEEFLTQLRAMQSVLPVTPENLCWDDGLMGLNVLRAEHIDLLLKRLEAWKPIDLLVIDPIYMMLAGGLSTDEGGSAIARCLTAVKRVIGCSVLFTNQTKRPRHTSTTGDVIQESHPFYGSRWIEAHVHTAYHMSKMSKEHTGVTLTNKKDRIKGCLPKLTLLYRPEHMTCTLEEPRSSESLLKLLEFLKKHHGQETDFYAIQEAIGCSHSYLRALRHHADIKGKIEVVEQPGKKSIWRVK